MDANLLKQNPITLKTLLFTILLCFAVTKVGANSPPIPQFLHYGVEDGLSQITVHDFVEDKQGFIWVGTQRGVDRFDGHRFVHISSGEAPFSLPGSSVYDLELDPITGVIWAATIGGLAFFDPISLQVTHVPLIDHGGYRHQIAKSLHFDGDNRLWVGTENSLFVYHQETGRFIPAPAFSLRLKNINDIEQDNNNRFWLATGQGLYVYDGKTTQAVLAQELSIELNSLLFDEEEYLWVATSGLGLVKANVNDTTPSITRAFTPENSPIDSLVFDILPRPDGSKLVASFEKLVSIDETSSLPVADFTTGLIRDLRQKSARVYSLFESSQGIIFIGSWDSGLFTHDPDSIKFKRLDYSDEIKTYNVGVGPDNSILLSNNKGLWIRHANNVVEGPYNLQDEYRALAERGYISRILYDGTRNVSWLAGRFGLAYFDHNDNTFTLTAHDDKQGYSLLLSDQGKTLWMGTYNQGLFKLDADTLTVLSNWDMSLVIDLFQFSDERVWAATLGGLYRVFPENDTIQMFEHDVSNYTSLSHSVVTSMYPLSPNRFLVTTQAGGTNVMEVSGDGYNDVLFKRVFEDTVLNNLSVGGIAADRSGHLWMSTTQGVVQLNPETGKTTEYNSRHGAFDSGYYIGSSAQDNDGAIYFTGVEGTTVFHPDDIGISAFQPQVLFTGFSVMGTPYGVFPFPTTGKGLNQAPLKISLDYDTLFLKTDFVAIDYANPKSNQYAYRLLGLNDSWQPIPEQQHSLTLTNLNPGTYTLEIKASNIDGVWSPNIASMQIEIRPPWWKTLPAIALLFISASLTVFAIFRWRVSILKSQSANLSQLVEARTQELEQAIQKLTILSSTDPLTSLLNRRAFSERADQEMTRFRRGGNAFSLLLIDIDYFKAINDNYGHDTGDTVLTQLATVMKRHSRTHDIVARWGGEEFIVLLPDTIEAQAIAAAQEIRRQASTILVDNQANRLCLTIGVCEVSPQFDSIEACIKEADRRLYVGKDNGRNTIVARNGIIHDSVD